MNIKKNFYTVSFGIAYLICWNNFLSAGNELSFRELTLTPQQIIIFNESGSGLSIQNALPIRNPGLLPSPRFWHVSPNCSFSIPLLSSTLLSIEKDGSNEHRVVELPAAVNPNATYHIDPQLQLLERN